MMCILGQNVEFSILKIGHDAYMVQIANHAGQVHRASVSRASLLKFQSRINDFLNLEPVEDMGLTKAEIDLLKNGKKINAIKLVRERLNNSLVEAKDMVEAWIAKYPDQYPAPPPWPPQTGY